MRSLTTADFPKVLDRLLEFERQSFGDYPYTPAPERLTLWWQTANFFLAGVEDETTGRLDSLFTVVLTTTDQYQAFKEGTLSSSKAMAPHDGDPKKAAAIYIPTLIVGDRYWMPVIFKSLMRELDAGMKARGLHSEIVFATAADKRAKFLLSRFGFSEAGEYKDGYKIMTATRASSALYKNMVR